MRIRGIDKIHRNSALKTPDEINEYFTILEDCIESVYQGDPFYVSDKYGTLPCVNYITKVATFNPDVPIVGDQVASDIIRRRLLQPRCHSDTGATITCMQKVLDDPVMAHDVIRNRDIFPHDQRIFNVGGRYVSGVEYAIERAIQLQPDLDIVFPGDAVHRDDGVKPMTTEDYNNWNSWYQEDLKNNIAGIAYIAPLSSYGDVLNAPYCTGNDGSPVSCLNKVINSSKWDDIVDGFTNYRSILPTVYSDDSDIILTTNFNQPCEMGDEVVSCVEKMIAEGKLHTSIIRSFGTDLSQVTHDDMTVPGLRVSGIERLFQIFEQEYRNYIDDPSLEAQLSSKLDRISDVVESGLYDLSTIECRDAQHRPISCLERVFQFIERYYDADVNHEAYGERLHGVADMMFYYLRESNVNSLDSTCMKNGQSVNCMERYIDLTLAIYQSVSEHGAERETRRVTVVDIDDLDDFDDLDDDTVIDFRGAFNGDEDEDEEGWDDEDGDWDGEDCDDGGEGDECEGDEDEDDGVLLPRWGVDLRPRDGEEDQQMYEDMVQSNVDARRRWILMDLFTKNLGKPQCHDPQTGDMISCYDYIVRHPEADEDVKKIYPFMVLKNKNIAQLPEPLRSNIRKFIRENIENIHPENIKNLGVDAYVGDEYTISTEMMNIGREICDVYAEGSKERRQCYDKLCLRLISSIPKSETFVTPELRGGNAFQKRRADRTWVQEWARSFIDEPLGHEQEYDNAWLYTNHDDRYNLCGTWTITVDSDIVDDYRDTISSYISTFNMIGKAVRETYKGRPVYLQIEPYTAQNGDLGQYVIKYIDIETGNVTVGRPQRIGKIAEVIRKYSPSLYFKIRPHLTRKPSNKSRTYTLTISRRPADFIRASSCQNWMSCFNMKDGMHMNSIPDYFEHGAYIAYVSDNEWSPQWYTRMFVIPMKNRDTGEFVGFSVQDKDVYGLETLSQAAADALKMILYEHGYRTNIAYSSDAPERINNFRDYAKAQYVPMYHPTLSELEMIDDIDDDENDDIDDIIHNEIGDIDAEDDGIIDAEADIGNVPIGKDDVIMRNYIHYMLANLHDPEVWSDTIYATNVTDAIYSSVREKRGTSFLKANVPSN